MLQVVRRIREAFEPRHEVREEIRNVLNLVEAARAQTAHSAEVVKSLREQVDKEAQAWHDRT